MKFALLAFILLLTPSIASACIMAPETATREQMEKIPPVYYGFRAKILSLQSTDGSILKLKSFPHDIIIASARVMENFGRPMPEIVNLQFGPCSILPQRGLAYYILAAADSNNRYNVQDHPSMVLSASENGNSSGTVPKILLIKPKLKKIVMREIRLKNVAECAPYPMGDSGLVPMTSPNERIKAESICEKNTCERVLTYKADFMDDITYFEASGEDCVVKEADRTLAKIKNTYTTYFDLPLQMFRRENGHYVFPEGKTETGKITGVSYTDTEDYVTFSLSYDTLPASDKITSNGHTVKIVYQ